MVLLNTCTGCSEIRHPPSRSGPASAPSAKAKKRQVPVLVVKMFNSSPNRYFRLFHFYDDSTCVYATALLEPRILLRIPLPTVTELRRGLNVFKARKSMPS